MKEGDPVSSLVLHPPIHPDCSFLLSCSITLFSLAEPRCHRVSKGGDSVIITERVYSSRLPVAASQDKQPRCKTLCSTDFRSRWPA